MPTFEEASTPRDRAIDLIRGEIARAENDRVPTSRQRLSQLITANMKIPPREAAEIVDQHCDAEAPGVPHYLQEEFTMPYLKIMAVVNSLLGLGFVSYAASNWHARKPSALLFVLAAAFILAAALAWFKTIQNELAKQSLRD